MFGEMRAALGITKGQDILESIYALPESEQQAAHDKIQAIERAAMQKQVPQAGLVTLMEYLDSKDVKKGICTRNFEYDAFSLLFYCQSVLSASIWTLSLVGFYGFGRGC